MGLGTACADSSERPAFTLQAWISSTVNRLKGRDGVSKQQRSLACHHLPPVSSGLSKQPDFSSTREVRVSLSSLQPDAEAEMTGAACSHLDY